MDVVKGDQRINSPIEIDYDQKPVNLSPFMTAVLIIAK
jgi:hypothetical protein